MTTRRTKLKGADLPNEPILEPLRSLNASNMAAHESREQTVGIMKTQAQAHYQRASKQARDAAKPFYHVKSRGKLGIRVIPCSDWKKACRAMMNNLMDGFPSAMVRILNKPKR